MRRCDLSWESNLLYKEVPAKLLAFAQVLPNPYRIVDGWLPDGNEFLRAAGVHVVQTPVLKGAKT